MNSLIPLQAISIGILDGSTFFVFLEGYEYSCKIELSKEWKCLELKSLAEKMIPANDGKISLEDFLNKHQLAFNKEIAILSYRMSLVKYIDVLRFVKKYLNGNQVCILSDIDVASIGFCNESEKESNLGLVYQDNYTLIESGNGILEILNSGTGLNALDSEIANNDIDRKNIHIMSNAEFVSSYLWGILLKLFMQKGWSAEGIPCVFNTINTSLDYCVSINGSVRTYETLISKDQTIPVKKTEQIYVDKGTVYLIIDGYHLEVPLLDKFGYHQDKINISITCSPFAYIEFEITDAKSKDVVKFKLMELLSLLDDTTVGSKRNNDGYTGEELEYLEEIKLCLEEDSVISTRERRLLERIRQQLGISEQRATELEASLMKSQLTEEEQEYLDEYKTCLEEEGEITPKKRRILDKFRKTLGISEERALEIEKQ